LKSEEQDVINKYKVVEKLRKRFEKLTTTYKTECSTSENKHNESLTTHLDTKEKKIKEINLAEQLVTTTV